MIDGIIPTEIQAGPDAIRATVRTALAAAQSAGSALSRQHLRRIFVLGNGTSYHSALAATALYARDAGADDPIAIPMTAGQFRTYPPVLDRRDAVVGISASGEFVDVVSAFSDLRGVVPTVGIVHVPGSSLTRLADHLVLSAGGESSVPVMTKTFSSTLVATELTLQALLGDEALDRTAGAVLRAADDAEATLAGLRDSLETLVDALVPFDHVFVVGAGLAHVAALEAALKLKEIALIHAEGTETWEATSGAATMIDERCAVIALCPNGPGRAATSELVRNLAGWGARTIEVGAEAAAPESVLIGLPADADEDHSALTTVPPVALIAFALARRRGIDPDRPTWVARYHRQGLRHIVGVDETT